jgi:hypothetical protein
MSFGRSITISSSTEARWVTLRPLAPVTTIDTRTPRPSINKWRLRPFFPPIGRIATKFSEHQWCVEQSSINTLPTAGNPFHVIVFGKPHTPKRYEKPGPQVPVHKVSMDYAWAAKAILGQWFPLAACSEYLMCGIKSLPVIKSSPHFFRALFCRLFLPA